MARIAGINIPMNKHVVIGLTHIFGIGNSRAARICDAAGVKYSVKGDGSEIQGDRRDIFIYTGAPFFSA